MANYIKAFFLLLSCHQFIYFCAGQKVINIFIQCIKSQFSRCGFYPSFFVLFLKYNIALDRIETNGESGDYFSFDNIDIVKQEGDGNAIAITGKAELLKDIDKSQ